MKEKLFDGGFHFEMHTENDCNIVWFIHGHIKWNQWAFYFLLQSKSYHTDTVLMVVMPSGYDKKKSFSWCVMKGNTESTSPRRTAGVLF